MDIDSVPLRLFMVLVVALLAHFAAVSIRVASRRLLRSLVRSEAKLLTITGFTTSVVVFGIYFGAVGFVLSELGVSLTTYLASASVIGLAVSFGSQGLVQDVITGLTVVTSDLIDVGDMVDIGGQVGIVESVGMRFTALVSFTGAHVYVPNRSIGNVINYPKGYIRAFVDVRLPAEPQSAADAERRVIDLSRAAYEQHPGILLLPPSFESERVDHGYAYLRVKFRIWPGQVSVLEQAVKPGIVYSLKELDAGYADWMVTIHYRAEPGDPEQRLPRPAALVRREGQLENE